jgi:hypothetical protein
MPDDASVVSVAALGRILTFISVHTGR